MARLTSVLELEVCFLHQNCISYAKILEFAQGKVDPHEAGAQGGKSSGTNTEPSGQKTGSNKSGGSSSGGMVELHITIINQSWSYADFKVEFAHGKVDPVEAGKKGGSSS
jgi:hypothetical protein